MSSKLDANVGIEAILGKLKKFSDNSDLGNTEQYVIDSLNSDTNVCLICIESISNKDPIWNCEGCFEHFHIVCIQNWIREGSYLATLNNAENKPKEKPWNCPKCRREYRQSECPTGYFCYCKKVRDPVFDPWSVPHSCSQRCEKPKQCSHSCLTLCHPGPCPPCPKMVSSRCHCGKLGPESRRCSNKQWSCGKPCDRSLTCRIHKCEQKCHSNECEPCSKTSVQFCKCKKNSKEIVCAEGVWKCDQKCNKKFSCGFHFCEEVCHSPGMCGQCPKSLIRNCPCGKSKFQKPCTEEVPTCGDTCEKPLDCGMHRCVRRCHFGACEKCMQIVSKKCRCGIKEKSMPCYSEFTCESKCNKMRNCGKHKCNRKCCDGNCSPCEQTCNKPLNCKNHKCASLCHSGPCYPCPTVVEIKCPCGESKMKLPCVKSKANVKVPCRHLCKKISECDHGRIQEHRCHYGDCPACNLECRKIMKCGHSCKSKCHSSVLVEEVENKNRDGPWVALNVKKVLKRLDCNDCEKPVNVGCLGGHERCDLPCFRARPYNCGSKCARPLNCSNHACELDCHSVPDTTNFSHQQFGCEECERECEVERPKGCEHACSIGQCHPGECPACNKLVKLKCNCGGNVVYAECSKWNSTRSKLERALLQSCQVPCGLNMSCGHQCSLTCHSAPCSNPSECVAKVTLRCKCKTLKKSFICSQMSSEEVVFDKKSIEVKKFLKCGAKCEEKKLGQQNKDELNGEKQSETVNLNGELKPRQISLKSGLSVLAFLVLLVSCLFYYFLDKF